MVAATAELLETNTSREFEALGNYQLVDDIPEVFAERQIVRNAAQMLLESRRDHADKTGVEYESVDALSTANGVLEAEKTFGRNSNEYSEKWNALLLDCQRLVGEWYRKNTSEYFEPVRQTYDGDKKDFFSHGWSIRQLTENALVPITEDPEEEARRVNERVEEATPHIVRSLGSLSLGKGIITISQCTDSAILSYQTDMKLGRKHRGYRGYVPEIEKVMIRHIAFDPDSNDRFETQIGLPGNLWSHETIQIMLEEKGVDASGMDKTELHGAQILADADPIEFIKHGDRVAGEQWSLNIFMGEAVPDDFVKDYDKFKQEAHERKEAMRGLSKTVALFVLDLAEENYDRKKAPELVENFVKNTLLNVAKKDETVAEQMFDVKTAIGLRNVAELESQGRFTEANELMKMVEREAPGGGSCGGGSCGLESVVGGSADEKDLRKKMGASESDTIVRDKERACRCGNKTIVYAYNQNKVIKYCESCKAHENKTSKVA